ncbi:hypothetical protein [Flexibacterium corallicola]|uniref:hypothetical protein n=1 Tax=Flexibacterium corallicola TaxID=3037259 RepID=UPI00286EF64B|nr:hypothetical protein [Pseudovibrio sp. M1P-2-3]
MAYIRHIQSIPTRKHPLEIYTNMQLLLSGIELSEFYKGHYMRAVAFLSLMFLVGCAGSPTYMRMLERDGTIRIDSHPEAINYDYVVSIRNIVDIGFNPSNKETREDVALKYVQQQCPSAFIVNEEVIEMGKYLTGRDARSYKIFIKCGNSI